MDEFQLPPSSPRCSTRTRAAEPSRGSYWPGRPGAEAGSHDHEPPLSALGTPLASVTHTHDGSTHTHVEKRTHHGGVPAGPPPRLHLRGTVLPGARGATCGWSTDACRSRPSPTRETVATGVWILPGLVDAHCHIGLGHQGVVDAETAERQALTDRDAGTLLIRDAGSPADTHWIDERDDLHHPRGPAHRAAVPLYPQLRGRGRADAFVAEVETQARHRGDGWVKIVGDWIDRDIGDLQPALAGRRRQGGHRGGPCSRRARDRALFRRALRHRP